MSRVVVAGTIVAFDSATYLALVMLHGSVAEVEMPVGEWVAAGSLAADDEVAVLLFDASNNQAGVVLGPFGAAPAAYFEQAESAAPSAPASGFLRWFADSTQSWGYFINDAGAAVPAGLAALSLMPGAAVLDAATLVVVQTVHQAISYADAANQNAYWSFRLPAGWAGRTLAVRLFWAPSSTNGGDCRWACQAWVQQSGTTLSSVATVGDQSVSTANGTTDRAQVHTATFALAGFNEGDAMSFRVLRTGANAADTFTGAARLLSVELSVVG